MPQPLPSLGGRQNAALDIPPSRVQYGRKGRPSAAPHSLMPASAGLVFLAKSEKECLIGLKKAFANALQSAQNMIDYKQRNVEKRDFNYDLQEGKEYAI